MKVHFPPHDMALLGGAVAHSLEDAFHNLKPSEPQLVANLVFELPKHVNQLNLSGAAKVKAGGVFVHAQPFVTCASFPAKLPASVEIGDLLLVRTLVINKKVEERRALLLQAKKVNGIPAVPDNANQWHLYEQWPKFTYAAGSVGLKGKKRHIKEPDMYDAAKYLLIGKDSTKNHWHGMCCVDWQLHRLYHWPGVCIHHTAHPTKSELGRYRCFAGELVEFMAGNAGKVFDKPAWRTRGWNRVIHDLISETAKAKTIFMGRAAGRATKDPRGSGLMFMTSGNPSAFFMVAGGGGKAGARVGGRDCELDGEIADGFNKPPDVPGEWGGGDDGGGISIIEIVVELSNG